MHLHSDLVCIRLGLRVKEAVKIEREVNDSFSH
ncbi:hypothetical protein DFR27_0641 [Umboniibacter marinipuniceus]|uniref:Uncharacterized protein n=1 Tax=Umboniibacter marinipuniceus TaxID=569599 RepID=A0A3M0ADV8_9GAMM|nr:hypothetical protein DFR27_0641 [Umboniibacter marinipuniceus]